MNNLTLLETRIAGVKTFIGTRSASRMSPSAVCPVRMNGNDRSSFSESKRMLLDGVRSEISAASCRSTETRADEFDIGDEEVIPSFRSVGTMSPPSWA